MYRQEGAGRQLMETSGPARPWRKSGTWTVDLRHEPEGWSLVLTAKSLENWCLDHLVLHEVGHHLNWYRRYWSKANHRKVEAVADS